MNFIKLVKNNLTRLPYCVGAPISLVPYSFRPGIAGVYRRRNKEIEYIATATKDQKQAYVFERIKKIAAYSYDKIPFYRELYKGANVNPHRFGSFFDLRELPVITKADLQKVPIEYRSSVSKKGILVNTGGSSGQPLDFFIEPSSVGHEWAHMHHIWKSLGFKQSDIKVVFAGRSALRDVVEYDSARHQMSVDIYRGWEVIADKLYSLFCKFSPKYLHGYPSSIFDFVYWLDSNDHPLLNVLREKVEGIFLGSEHPAPEARRQVESLLGCKSVSWYGHTERSVLAWESEYKDVYTPFLSYGFAETVDEGEEAGRLVCTGYYNYISPLIRYDTGDLVDSNVSEGFLESFRIKNGREGDFIVDKAGNKIFLTALIFGRHHKLFEQASHIQVRQVRPGVAEILIVPRGELTAGAASVLFDSSNVLLDFFFKIISEPMRTPAGKVPLLVRETL